jgi:polo-like kinase 1
VVKYERSFEDAVNFYIILELCPNQTLNELIKRRKRISELEARYYLRQISLGIKDFQEQMVIHRDLKLGNLLLTENLEIRISDFGLAAKLNHPGERRKTMCGTPNYIAP